MALAIDIVNGRKSKEQVVAQIEAKYPFGDRSAPTVALMANLDTLTNGQASVATSTVKESIHYRSLINMAMDHIQSSLGVVGNHEVMGQTPINQTSKAGFTRGLKAENLTTNFEVIPVKVYGEAVSVLSNIAQRTYITPQTIQQFIQAYASATATSFNLISKTSSDTYSENMEFYASSEDDIIIAVIVEFYRSSVQTKPAVLTIEVPGYAQALRVQNNSTDKLGHAIFLPLAAMANGSDAYEPPVSGKVMYKQTATGVQDGSVFPIRGASAGGPNLFCKVTGIEGEGTNFRVMALTARDRDAALLLLTGMTAANADLLGVPFADILRSPRYGLEVSNTTRNAYTSSSN